MALMNCPLYICIYVFRNTYACIANRYSAQEYFMASPIIYAYLFFLSLFIYFERERERERERESKQERGREREREKIPSRLHTVSAEPHVGLKSANHKIMT